MGLHAFPGFQSTAALYTQCQAPPHEHIRYRRVFLAFLLTETFVIQFDKLNYQLHG